MANFSQSFSLALFVPFNFVPYPQLPFFLLRIELFSIGYFFMSGLQLFLNFLASHFCVEKAILHDGNVLLKSCEVFGEHG
jgi:hypothetical protein